MSSTKKPWLGPTVLVVACAATFALGLLANSVTERRAEGQIVRMQTMPNVAEWESDNAAWGRTFPREFNSWELTKNMSSSTRYGGSAVRDHLANNPLLVVMWAGYPFAKDYNAPRGHFYALEDLRATGRLNAKTPATCYSCKSPDVPRLMARDGVAEFYSAEFKKYTDDVASPIGCADCHDNKTMALRISRPALREAFDRMGKDITKATHQEMRSLVCAQCHVEYYFDGEGKYLTFPWDKGLGVEEMDAYYQEDGHVDWTHAISGAKMIKMQHPDYEVYSKGIHAYRGVSCADCHMPYKSEGGIKFTDHQIRSPLENVANSCGVCHRWGEDEIKDRVYAIQDKNQELLRQAEHAITALHLEIGDAAAKGAADPELASPRRSVSQAQMYWDYVAANNGMGFHAPQECARILGKAVNIAQLGRIEMARIRAKHGAWDALSLPDLKDKATAQAFIAPFVAAQQAAAKKG